MLFSKLDIFGSQIGLNYQRDSVFKTSFGGIMSLAFIAFVGIFFWTEIVSFLNKENVTFQTYKDYSIDPPTVAVSNHEFMFAIKLDYPDFLTRPLFNITWERREYTTAQNGTKIKTTYNMQFEPCRLDHWTGLPAFGGIDWIEQFKLQGMQTFLCPRIEDVVRFGGSYSAYGFQFAKIQVTECKNTTDNTRLWQPSCQTKKEVEAYFNKTQSVTIIMRMSNYVINPSDPKTPIKSYIEDSLFFPVQPGTAYQTADIYLTENQVNTDQSILPFLDIQKEKYLVYNGGNFRLQYVIGNTNKIVADFFIRKDPISLTHQRQFTKISQMASFIGGFCQSFILIAAFIVHQYNGYICTFQLANKLYDFDFGEGEEKTKRNTFGNQHQMSQFGQRKTVDLQKGQVNIANDVSNKLTSQDIQKLKEQQQIKNIDSPTTLEKVHNVQNVEKQSRLTHKKSHSMIKPKSREEGGLLPLEQIQKIIQKQKSNLIDQTTQPSQRILSPQFMLLSKNEPVKLNIQSNGQTNRQNVSNQVEQISVIDQSILPETPKQDEIFSPATNMVSFNENKNNKYNNTQQSPNQEPLNFNYDSCKRETLNLNCQDSNQPSNRNQSVTINKNVTSQMNQSRTIKWSSNQIVRDSKSTPMNAQGNQELYDEKQFLKKEFIYLSQRDKSIKLTLKYFLYKLSCGRFFKTKQVILLQKAQESIEKEMDIFMILNGLKEIQKLKDLLLTKEQQILFNFFPKPLISVDKEQELPSRLKLEENKKEINESLKLQTKKQSQLLQNHSKKLNLSLKVASLVHQATSQLKKPLQTKQTDGNNIDVYQRLYEAYSLIQSQNQTGIKENRERLLVRHKYKNMQKKQNDENSIVISCQQDQGQNNQMEININDVQIQYDDDYGDDDDVEDQNKANKIPKIHYNQSHEEQIGYKFNSNMNLPSSQQTIQRNENSLIIAPNYDQQNQNYQTNINSEQKENHLIVFDEVSDYYQENFSEKKEEIHKVKD